MPQPPSSSHDPSGRWMSNSADGSVNGKVGRPQARIEVAAEVGACEGFDRAGEVAEGDALVDDETLDLMEDRHVRRVGGVVAKDATGRDDVDRRLLFEHHADLHRRGVRAQHGAAGRTPFDVERVPHASCRDGPAAC